MVCASNLRGMVGSANRALISEPNTIRPADLMIEQRPDAHPVPREQQALPAVVPDGESELPVEMAEKPLALLFVEMHQDFGVGPGVEAVAPGFQTPPGFRGS